jgi:arsenite-transporting ATPase
MPLLSHPTRILFFTGKGGVGKTSIACAVAVGLADAGKQVLLVSTDPASNLDEVLGVELTNQPLGIPNVPGLFALNLDPEQAAAAYREKMVGPYRNLLPPAAIASMEEQFSGSCTLEIAAFDEFSRLLGDPHATTRFDHVLFDTAPTGHTLRLLTLPSSWAGYLEDNTTGTSCIGPLAGLAAQQELYQQTAIALANAELTTLVLVTRPEAAAFREAARTSGELAALGVHNQQLVINGIFEARSNDPLAVAMQARAEVALAEMPAVLGALPQTRVTLRTTGVVGIESLRRLGMPEDFQDEEPGVRGLHPSHPLENLANSQLGDLVEQIAKRPHGVVMTMGKGGVGKTTVAAAVAVQLAQRGFPVHLTTTDPAAHVLATLAGDTLPNLTVDRIDPAVETELYQQEVLGSAGANLDASGKALLEEDLRSPCTEEIAIFRAFARAVEEGEDRFVVLDTAPTGHTILLLDAALAYHREVARQASQVPTSVEKLLPRLRDPQFTHMLIITLPEATPVHEAAALQKDLRRAEIEPFAWVINQALTPLAVTDPGLIARQAYETQHIQEVREQHARQLAIIPWQAVAPTGVKGLLELSAR